MCDWLLDNEGNFKPAPPDTAGSIKSETVRSYIQYEIEAYLRVPASNGRFDIICLNKM